MALDMLCDEVLSRLISVQPDGGVIIIEEDSIAIWAIITLPAETLPREIEIEEPVVAPDPLLTKLIAADALFCP